MKGLSEAPAPHRGGPARTLGRGLPPRFEKRVLATTGGKNVRREVGERARPQSHLSGLPRDKAGHDARGGRRGGWRELAHSLPCGNDDAPPLMLTSDHGVVPGSPRAAPGTRHWRMPALGESLCAVQGRDLAQREGAGRSQRGHEGHGVKPGEPGLPQWSRTAHAGRPQWRAMTTRVRKHQGARQTLRARGADRPATQATPAQPSTPYPRARRIPASVTAVLAVRARYGNPLLLVWGAVGARLTPQLPGTAGPAWQADLAEGGRLRPVCSLRGENCPQAPPRRVRVRACECACTRMCV